MKSSLSRRKLLSQLALAAGSSLLVPAMLRHELRGQAGAEQLEDDEAVFRRTLEVAHQRSLGSLPIGNIVAAVGQSFLGSPYAARTLEVPGTERLVVNLRAFDCVTYVESVLALARCIKLGKRTFEDFVDQLQRIRYRKGILDGYSSRLHYFIDWIGDNQQKGIVRDVTSALGGTAVRRRIHFMSAHKSAYRQLSDPCTLEAIAAIEARLSQRTWFTLPAKVTKAAQQRMKNGDILGVTTTTEGLDIGHTGIAVLNAGMVKFLHAPLSEGMVQFSRGSVEEYVSSLARGSGLVVARPQEPAHGIDMHTVIHSSHFS